MIKYKRSTKTVMFEIPEYLYKHFTDIVNKVIKPKEQLTTDYFLRALAINRAISLGFLNELGEPNEWIIPPTLDLSKIETDGININSLRDICSERTDK